MSIETLSSEVRQFVKSSAYQFGDRTGFAINLSEGLTLPGKCSPASYLDGLGLDTMPEKVMVICSGNGGLAVECFARGAKQVVAVEPRSRYNKGIQGVKRLLDKLWRLEKCHDRALVWHPHWLRVGKDQGFKDFDLILWPEGVEEVTTPKETFQAVADCLTPGGRLMVELAHGNHQWVEKINSWRPTGHAVNDMADAVFGGKPTSKTGGRNATTKIYTLTLPGKKKSDAKAKAAADAKAKALAAQEKRRTEAEAEAKRKRAASAKAAAAKKKAAEEAAKAAEEAKAPAPLEVVDMKPDEAVADAVPSGDVKDPEPEKKPKVETPKVVLGGGDGPIGEVGPKPKSKKKKTSKKKTSKKPRSEETSKDDEPK